MIEIRSKVIEVVNERVNGELFGVFSHSFGTEQVHAGLPMGYLLEAQESSRKGPKKGEVIGL